jgi:two-component system, cell cycle sensor histidine kinase and response regulator CckA
VNDVSLRILCLEDNRLDAELIALRLQNDGIEHTIDRVDTREHFEERLETGQFDLVLADYALPAFDGLTALRLVRARYPDVPFIFVSGASGEDIAIEAVKSGATDYVLKQRLTRLTPVVRRAVREARERLERQATERALAETERRHRSMVQYLRDLAIIFLDPAGHVASWNAGAELLTGRAEQEIMGQHIDVLFPDEADGMGSVAEWLRRAASGEEIQVEIRHAHANGSSFWAEVLVASVRDAGHSVEGFVMIVRDVTERRLAQDRALIARRMESTATVMGGIAHEFSNILNNVLGFTTIIKKYIHDHARVLKYSQAIEQSVQRADEVTQRLLAFARVEERTTEPVAIGPLVDEVTELLRAECPDTITIHKRTETGLPEITGVRTELRQALVNLCSNARDAILAHASTGGRGTITLEATRTRVNEGLVTALGLPVGDECLLLRIVDTGVGIRQEIADRIFDPFFTTKESGRGAGLGLSIVYTVIRGHRGVVLVDSTPGQGSVFSVYLPVHDPHRRDAGRNGDAVAPCSELILFVDDEQGVLEFGRDILIEHGYRVLTARDSREALALYGERHDEISMVILDLILPGMDGGQTYLAMKQINKNLKAMFCSGYTPDQLISSLLQEERLLAVRKPFRIDEFLAAVRECLDTPRS